MKTPSLLRYCPGLRVALFILACQNQGLREHEEAQNREGRLGQFEVSPKVDN